MVLAVSPADLRYKQGRGENERQKNGGAEGTAVKRKKSEIQKGIKICT